MEIFVTLAIPALLAVLVCKAILLPIGMLCKTAVYSAGGFLCLWLLNTVSGFTGLYFPVNAVTVLLAGFGGVPGMGLIALLEVL